ncbi:MAG TPA: GNA1162 family protein [Nitrospirota bacterium]|nr:GNA1162 family protein [Nitrospirota bacterium]
MNRIARLVAAGSVVLALSACAVPRPVPRYHDASNPLKRVAVLPMKNDTTDVDGPEVVRKKMIEALEGKSYVIRDVKETDQILRDQMGINLGGQLSLTTPQKLGEVLGVDGVLYGTLMDFDETTTGLLDVRKVRATFRLVNTRNGQAFWERGLGVRTETRMSGRSGSVASAAARAADAREKDVPWVTIESVETGERNVGQAFAYGLGAKLLTKAVGIHLNYEATEMARRVTANLPWGPGPGAVAVVSPQPQSAPLRVQPPDAPAFGYLDYGKRNFSAELVSVTLYKGSGERMKFTIPIAKAGERLRMDIDLAAMANNAESMPQTMNRISLLQLGDKRQNYTLYPNVRKYIVNTPGQQDSFAFEKPKIEKTNIGSEVVDGHPADKYRVRITYQNGRVEEGFIWNARDLDALTIKSEVENSDAQTTTELKNISLRTPPPSLFEIPSDYTEAKGLLDLMNGPTN